MPKKGERKGNAYIIDGDTARIVVESKKHGRHEVLVDADMVETLRQYTWCVVLDWGSYRAMASELGEDGRWRRVSITRVVLGRQPDGLVVDHIAKDSTLDNRRANLRVCSHLANMHNMHHALGYTFDKETGKWAAVIQCGGRKKRLGRFPTAEEARAAYLAAKAKRDAVSFSGGGACASVDDLHTPAARPPPRGYSLHRKTGKWQVSVRVNGVSRYVGLFATEAEAHAAFLAAKAGNGAQRQAA